MARAKATPRMVCLTVRLRFDAAPERVFEAISNHERFLRGFPVRTAGLIRAGHIERNGLGAVRRVCTMGLDFVEEITLFDRPKAYEYRVRQLNLAARHTLGRLDVIPCPDGAEVVWRTHYAVLTPVIGPLLSVLLAPFIQLTFSLLLRRARQQLRTA